ncbi:haloacid dehalogenase type II [Sediminicurvatus halobius]|uniref:(S)-2-haloacid dehalogenase n=1 Tax=Sediminicurvatus halobius TaxID=2182432 RepID=A0A2U2N024_9GAMM|nr:haloacid dehalogenase type II [Spiribacter halobius]PWG62601.1 haloacid dehalogenase type II [Spiribacter halobius]UEX78481.1 haloacid dehalogenase type II [Spiribacter halobius]
MPRVVVFDVNETLLDLSALDAEFEAAFGSAAVRREWFTQVLQSAMTVTLSGLYRNFSEVGAAALSMVAERHGVSLSQGSRRAIAEGMRRLPPHPEVPAALRRLREAGLTLAALTNSPDEVMEAQLAHAGLSPLFAHRISVDGARALKPALAVYRHAAQRLQVPTTGMLMVAAHGWDLAGAMSAGCGTAFVARPGQILDRLFPEPEIVGRDLGEVAEAILEVEV